MTDFQADDGTTDEKPSSGDNWSRVAQLYAKVSDEADPLAVTRPSNNAIFSAVESTLPFSEASYIIDMGSGHGPLIGGLLNSEYAKRIPHNARIVAGDIAQEFIAMLEERKKTNVDADSESLWRRVEIQTLDARDLQSDKGTIKIGDEEVSHLLSSFVYYTMFGDEERGFAEALRVLQPGGVFVATNLGPTDWGSLPDFVIKVRPDKTNPMDLFEKWKSAELVKHIYEKAGFKDVVVNEYQVGLKMETYEETIEFVVEVFPFMKPLMADMSEGEVKEVKKLMREFLVEKQGHEPLQLSGTGIVVTARK